MKKITSIFAMLLMAVATLSLTSCNDDEDISNTLWGVWKGNLGMYYPDGSVDYQAAYSVLSFDKDPGRYASGTGHWIDYYDDGPYSYYATNITWSVDNGRVTIHSLEDDEYWFITDYSLSNDVFRGILEGEKGFTLKFSLFKTATPNWNDYDWGGWYESGYYGAGYAKQNTRSADSKTILPKRQCRGNIIEKQN